MCLYRDVAHDLKMAGTSKFGRICPTLALPRIARSKHPLEHFSRPATSALGLHRPNDRLGYPSEQLTYFAGGAG